MEPEGWTRPCTTLTVVDGDVVIVEVRGDLDSSNVDAFRQALAGLDGRGGCVLDLSDVLFIDSAGIGAVIGAIRRSRELGLSVAVVAVRPHVAHLLRTVGIDRIAPLVTGREPALDAVRPDALAPDPLAPRQRLAM